ncbi:MAG: endonuclease/exonuclease/phosphatase [Flavobacteriaceae bacterium]|nr:endonuclease/exonuclease/phosphatase [Flavobacteriaceae bacterium]|tara:strand:- start:225957 stop:226784 length:828 start_codon:yes stop_codon:yes gene_type:complete
MQLRGLFTIFLLGLLSTYSIGQTKLLTFNIRYDNKNDGPNWWEHRKGDVVQLLSENDPHIFGLQEALPHQTKFIQKHLSNYKVVNYLRDGQDSKSEGLPVFWKNEALELVASEVFWLSATPNTVSKGWDANLNRILVYCQFKDKKDNSTLHVFNAHFDHLGTEARLKSAQLILKIIKEKSLNDQKTIVMGDFNALPDSPPIHTLLKTLKDSADPVSAQQGTFTNFDIQKTAKNRIDYIFYKNLKIKNHEVITTKRPNGLYPSDHFPIMIEIKKEP